MLEYIVVKKVIKIIRVHWISLLIVPASPARLR